MSKEKIPESFQGWNAYAKWADSYKLRKEIVKKYSSSIVTYKNFLLFMSRRFSRNILEHCQKFKIFEGKKKQKLEVLKNEVKSKISQIRSRQACCNLA